MVGYTAFAHVILNFGILYLWLYYQLVDRELSRNFLVDPSQRQVGHPWNRLGYISLHNTHMSHSAQQNKAAYQQYKSSLLLLPRRKKFTMK